MLIGASAATTRSIGRRTRPTPTEVRSKITQGTNRTTCRRAARTHIAPDSPIAAEATPTKA